MNERRKKRNKFLDKCREIRKTRTKSRKEKKKDKKDGFDTEDRSSVLKLDTRHVISEKRRVATT